MSLLHLAKGRVDTAAEGIARAVLTASDRLARARLCGAQVQIAVAADDLDTARRAATELSDSAHRAAGDRSAPELDLDAAAARFEELGARLDLDTVVRLRAGDGLPGGLTPREVEVLRVVASGSTNREVAEELFLSEKTVARHLHNIYNKIGVSSRTAAAAYAFQHDLASPPK